MSHWHGHIACLPCCPHLQPVLTTATFLACRAGEAKFAEVAASMAHRGLARGTPLRTLALLLSNRQDLIYEASLAATAAAGSVMSPTAAAGPGPTPPGSAGTFTRPSNLNPAVGSGSGPRVPGTAGGTGPGLTSSGGSNAAAAAGGGGGGLFSPTGGSGSFGFFSPGAGMQGDALLTHWRENLAVMAANRTAGGVEAMMRLGDLLLSQQGQVRACLAKALARFVAASCLKVGSSCALFALVEL